jgi:hypothetical protein
LKRTKLAPSAVTALVVANTIVMLAGIGVFYLIIVRGISTNQMLAVVLPFLVLASAWFMLILLFYGRSRSN